MPGLKGRASFALAVAIGVLLVTAAFALSDPVAVALRIAGANPLYVAAACLLDLASIVFFALAWVAAARASGVEIGVVDGFVASVLGLMADKLVASASVSGELVRLAYVKGRGGASYAEFLATIVVHRFLYNVAFIVLLAIASVNMVARGAVPQAVTAVAALAVFSTLLASYVLAKPESLRGVFRALASRASGLLRLNAAPGLNLVDRVEVLTDDVARCVREAWRRRGSMVLAASLMLLQWVAGALELGVLFRSIGYDASVWTLLVAFPLHCYLTALPVGIPAALGVTEVGTLLVLTALGVERSAAMAVTVLVRFVEVWFEAVLGVATAAVAGVNVLSLRWASAVRELARAEVVER